MSTPERDLPNFRQAFSKYSQSLTYGTRWRYERGLFPAFGEFLLEHPELIIALAIDASILKTKRLSASDASDQVNTEKPR